MSFSAIQANLTRSVNRKDLERVLNRASVAGFQELHSKDEKDEVEEICNEKGFGFWCPNENGIAWNRERFHKGADKIELLPNGIDRVTVEPRFLNSQFLIDSRNKKILCFKTTHLTPAAFTRHPERIPIVKAQLQVIRESILEDRQNADAVIATGDWNINFLRDDTRRIVRNKFTRRRKVFVNFDMKKTGTHGSALYDYVVSCGKLEWLESNVLQKTDSDHDFQEVVYRWKG